MNKKAALDRNFILNNKGYDLVEMEIPEWGGIIYLKPLSAKEVTSYQTEIMGIRDADGIVSGDSTLEMITRLLTLTICDESGNTLFTKDDVAALNEKRFQTLIKIFRKAQEINGLDDDAEALAEKN